MRSMRQILFSLTILLPALVTIRSLALEAANTDNPRALRRQEPLFLSFEELKALYADPNPKGALGQKLDRFWKTPIVDNTAFFEGKTPRRLFSASLRRYLRVASWNIEKSLELGPLIEFLNSPEKADRMINPLQAPPGSKDHLEILTQRKKLLSADVLVLQEMDIGVKRSGYINAPAELAQALGMNYAYGAQQLEIDPVVLGIEKVLHEGGELDDAANAYYAADPARYKGIFGSAVLSRYPIKKAEVFQLRHQPYNWYAQEKISLAFLEKSRRFGSKAVFKNILTREIKAGGRIFMRVDLEVPELPEKTLTLINVHLEIKCMPEGRELQMAEILGYIKNIRHPVILLGDFNSAPTDLSPTSLSKIAKRTAKDPTTWFHMAVNYLSPNGLMINTTRGISNLTKNFQNPLARHIPVIGPNPVYGLFKMIENYRFSDGGAFDFRGSEDRSLGRKNKPLANSNERDRKGFKTTFQVKRPIGPLIGKMRLDWVFVKSYLKDPKDKKGSYRFAPHFGQTLEEMNTKVKMPFSDHHPNVVDLPFEEPPADLD